MFELIPKAKVRIETQSKCSNWDPKQMFELRPIANIRIETHNKCSNWDPQQIFQLRHKANVRIETQSYFLKPAFNPPKRVKTRYGLTHRSLWSPCIKCLNLGGPKSVSVDKKPFQNMFFHRALCVILDAFTNISKCFQNSWRYSQLKMQHQCQRHRWLLWKM